MSGSASAHFGEWKGAETRRKALFTTGLRWEYGVRAWSAPVEPIVLSWSCSRLEEPDSQTTAQCQALGHVLPRAASGGRGLVVLSAVFAALLA